MWNHRPRPKNGDLRSKKCKQLEQKDKKDESEDEEDDMEVGKEDEEEEMACCCFLRLKNLLYRTQL